MPSELNQLRIKYLKLLFCLIGSFLIILGAFNYYTGIKVLAYIKFVYALVLITASKAVERYYRATVSVIILLFVILMYFVIELHLKRGVWFLGIWYPVAVLSMSMLVDRIGAILASLYILAVSTYFLIEMQSFRKAYYIFYWVQLIMSLSLTSIFYFALSETWKRYEKILKERYEIDYLTGTLTRKKIFEIMKLKTEETNRYGFPFSVIMIDLDNFKEINDQKGHLAGDEVLKKVADAIKSSIRKVDYCGRYGGDEFIVIASHTDLEGARVLAERIREKVKSLNLGVTISVGVVEYKKGMLLKDLISQADKALYISKNTGKDRVTVIGNIEA